MVIGLHSSSLKEYLNRALIFVQKSKIGLNPYGSCILLDDDKAYVYNGDTGAIIKFPFKVVQPTLLFPFDLAKVVNNLKDDEDVQLCFDYNKLTCTFKSNAIELTIKLLDPKNFSFPTIPQDVEKFQIADFYSKVKNASFCCHEDASLPLLKAVQFKKGSVNATDQRTVWTENCESPQEFLVTEILRKHIEGLALEPQSIACQKAILYIFYNDITVFGARYADEKEAPNISNVFAFVDKQEKISKVVYDKDALAKKLEMLLSIYQQPTINIKCSDRLYIQNIISDDTDSKGIITLDIGKTSHFDNVIVNGELFYNGVTRFNQFEVMEKMVLFWNDTQKYAVSRRTV